MKAKLAVAQRRMATAENTVRNMEEGEKKLL